MQFTRYALTITDTMTDPCGLNELKSTTQDTKKKKPAVNAIVPKNAIHYTNQHERGETF